MITSRLLRVRENMKEKGLDQIIITQPQSIFYLTNQWVYPHDRLVALIITQKECKMLCYVLAVIHPEGAQVEIYHDTGDTIRRLSNLLEKGKTGIDEWMASKFLLPLQQARTELSFFLSDCVEETRMIKETDEVEKLHHAGKITDAVFAQAFSQIHEGMTELELGKIFSDTFEKQGVGRFHGDPMVSFGASAAEPHHTPGKIKLKRGDAICVDKGKRIEGYYSDMTRTIFFQTCSPKQQEVYEIVLQANLAAIAAVKPGVPLGEIDQVAREVITRSGYGAFFPHRTSHGIGIDYHEAPFDEKGKLLPVEENMCFSIEPGIYLPGEFGVRIEDIICVTKDGCKLLSHAPKTLQVVQ